MSDFKTIKAFAMDVDGVMTNGGILADNEGQLYPKKRRDSILIFSLNKRLSVLQTNELLLEMKEELLST